MVTNTVNQHRWDPPVESFLEQKTAEFKGELRAQAEALQARGALDEDRKVSISDVEMAYKYLSRYGSDASRRLTKGQIIWAILSYLATVVVGIATNNLNNGTGWVITFAVAVVVGVGAVVLTFMGGTKK